jgi:hypothetical protein
MVESLAAEVVACADLQRGLVVENVQPHERGAADAVHPHGVARDGRIKPPDAARPAGDGAELVAAFADLVPHLVEQLRREWAVADA